MAQCDNCKKSTGTGATSRHTRGVASHKFENRAHKNKRALKPNLHHAKIMFNGNLRQMLLCTKCLRRIKRDHPTTHRSPAVSASK